MYVCSLNLNRVLVFDPICSFRSRSPHPLAQRPCWLLIPPLFTCHTTKTNDLPSHSRMPFSQLKPITSCTLSPSTSVPVHAVARSSMLNILLESIYSTHMPQVGLPTAVLSVQGRMSRHERSRRNSALPRATGGSVQDTGENTRR